MSAKTYPGILPVIEYPYDWSRACYTPERLASHGGQVGSQLRRNMEAVNASVMSRNPFYAIAQFTGQDGNTYVVEGGFIMTRMHDFCGGLVVSSVWTGVRPAPKENEEWGQLWRALYYGYGETSDAQQAAVKQTAGPRAWHSTYRAIVPDLHAYVGPGPLSTERAEQIMSLSLGMGMVSLSWSHARRAIFVADRFSRQARSRDTMRMITPTQPAYLGTCKLYTWTGDEAIIRSPSNLGTHASEVTTGPVYVNPNTSHEVCLTTLVTTSSTGAIRHELPKEEIDKYANPLFKMMLPQGVFHNG
jgi:hypothetical protein